MHSPSPRRRRAKLSRPGLVPMPAVSARQKRAKRSPRPEASRLCPRRFPRPFVRGHAQRQPRADGPSRNGPKGAAPPPAAPPPSGAFISADISALERAARQERPIHVGRSRLASLANSPHCPCGTALASGHSPATSAHRRHQNRIAPASAWSIPSARRPGGVEIRRVFLSFVEDDSP